MKLVSQSSFNKITGIKKIYYLSYSKILAIEARNFA